jgi:hypothetical protein
VLQHRPIFFFQNRRSDLDAVFRGDRDEEALKRRMVEFAQRQTVGDVRFTFRAVRDDVGGVQ